MSVLSEACVVKGAVSGETGGHFADGLEDEGSGCKPRNASGLQALTKTKARLPQSFQKEATLLRLQLSPGVHARRRIDYIPPDLT